MSFAFLKRARHTDTQSVEFINATNPGNQTTVRVQDSHGMSTDEGSDVGRNQRPRASSLPALPNWAPLLSEEDRQGTGATGIPRGRRNEILDHSNSNAVNSQSPFPSRMFALILAVFSSAWASFTIYYAYNCFQDVPLSQRLLHHDPQKTIRTINVLSQVTMLLLGNLTDEVFENVRWAFAGSKRGVTALCFFALASSTSYRGVLLILFRNLTASLASIYREGRILIARDDPRLWGFQR